MDWLDIVALSVFFGLKNWFKNKNFISALKEFLITLLFIVLFKIIFSYIEIPDLPESLNALIFAGPIVLITIVLLFRAYKKNKK
ncbi:hypothetical protein QF028_001551 [Neobacillus sp. B4I6]|uniref:hypothetical protein n=1 Tax=Neobacillus sp. B4I6 TaxID=3373925 RepID=UPI003D1D79A9